MANEKIYSIKINGVSESINAVDALNKQLSTLESRIKALENSSVKVGSSGGGSKASSSSLKQEQAVQSEINKLKNEGIKLDAKIEAAQTDIYKRVQATKELYKETINDQKQLAANERLAANAYSNTMMGMKQRLADLKTMINTTDLGDSDKLKQMTQEANDLSNKLKEMEEAYGQFGRNVGNYKSAADGFNKIKVAVGDTVREFDNYRQASKTLKEERFALANSVGQEAQAYKDVDKALKTLESDYADLNKSSAVMDSLLDTMQSFTAIASIGQGLSTLFGIDNADFQDSMQKLMSLSLVLQGIEKLMLSIQKKEGLIGKGFNVINEALDGIGNHIRDVVQGGFDELLGGTFEEITTYIKMIKEAKKQTSTMAELTQGSNYFGTRFTDLEKHLDNLKSKYKIIQKLSLGFNFLSEWIGKAIKALAKLAGAFGLLALPAIIDFFSDVIKSLKTAESSAQRAAEAVKTLNAQLQARRELISSNYLRGAINEEEFLTQMYKAQSDALTEQIRLLGVRSTALQKNFKDWSDIFNMFDATQNTEFTGRQFIVPTTVGHGRMTTFGDANSNDLMITVNSLEEVEEAWKRCNKAIEENKDYISKWGSDAQGIIGKVDDWFNSLFVTVKDTEEVMRGLGNVKLSDFVADFQKVNEEFAKTKNAEKYAAELKRLKKEMNGNEVLTSVIANLDKYIPDEKVREAVQNIINEITRLDDAFNMTSPQQIHYWNQVRIDGMKEGWDKTKAQLDENERYEIQQYGKTQEQIDLIQKKYAQQRAEARKKANKDAQSKNKEHLDKLKAAEDEYQRLTIDLMKNGLAKQIAQLEEEKRQKLRKIKEDGVRVGELTKLTEESYQKKIYELRIAWAKKTEQVYVDMWMKIYQINHNAQQLGFENQLRDLETSYKQLQEKASEIISETASSTLPKMDKQYTQTLREEFNTRLANHKKYYEDVEKLSIEKLSKQIEIENSAATESMNDELRTLRSRYQVEDDELKTHLENGEITQKQYDEAIERLEGERYDNETRIQEKYNSESKAREQKHQEDIKKIKSQHMEDELAEYERYLNELSELDSSTPLIGWTGFINYDATKKRNNELIKSYKETFDKIQAYINNLMSRKGEFDPLEFDKLITNAKNAQKDIQGVIKNIGENTKIAKQELTQQIISMVDQSMQQVSSIMSSLSEITQNSMRLRFQSKRSILNSMRNFLTNRRKQPRSMLMRLIQLKMSLRLQEVIEDKS